MEHMKQFAGDKCLPGAMRSAERGGILVLFAIMLVVLVALTALAIDTNLMLTSQEEARRFVRLASLAAAERYYDSADCGGSECTHEYRMQQAIARISEISTKNVL